MSNYTISVEPNVLKAALLFAVKGDPTRKRLEGVCIQHAPSGSRLIATDGCRMLFVDLGTDVTATEHTQYVIERDVCELAIKAAKRAPVTIVWESAARITVGAIATADAQVAHGTYPDCGRVVPAEFTGEAAQYNAFYLADAAKADALMNDRRLGFTCIAHNGDGPALVHLGPCAFAIIMPMRGTADASLPAWFNRAAPEGAQS